MIIISSGGTQNTFCNHKCFWLLKLNPTYSYINNYTIWGSILQSETLSDVPDKTLKRSTLKANLVHMK